MYLASVDPAGGIYAIRSGRVIWHVHSHGGIMVNPVVGGDLVYVVTNGGGTYALRAADGREVWNFRPGTVTAGGADYATGAVPGPWLAGGRVYIGDGHGAVHALLAADGQEIWHFPVPGQGFDLAIGREAVYLGTEDGVVRALRARDGGQIWHFATGGADAAVTGARNTIYAETICTLCAPPTQAAVELPGQGDEPGHGAGCGVCQPGSSPYAGRGLKRAEGGRTV